MILIQQCFVLSITNSIILGSNFLYTHFAVLDIGNQTITLHCTDYTLINCLTHDLVHDLHQAKMAAPANTEISYKQFRKEM